MSSAGFEYVPPRNFSDVSELFGVWETEREEGAAKGFISTCAHVSNPAASAAKSMPPIPENKEACVNSDIYEPLEPVNNRFGFAGLTLFVFAPRAFLFFHSLLEAFDCFGLEMWRD